MIIQKLIQKFLRKWQPLDGQFIMDNYEKGLNIKTRPRLLQTTGFIIHQKHISARKPNKVGIVRAFVPGHGGDVWFVQHEDGTIGAYRTDELGLRGKYERKTIPYSL